MIVKNESKIIERCLKSTINIVDCISICDTGSSDNTISIIEDWIKINKIPGKVHKCEWKNFGHNRTLSYKKAKKSFPNVNYYLLLDADMVLMSEPDFVKDNLTADCYALKQVNGSLNYYNKRLLKSNRNWICKLNTHEYWTSTDSEIITENLESLWIKDINDGGSKSDKFERDIKLCIEGLSNSTMETSDIDIKRYKFYLARSYHDNGNLELAIQWYEKCRNNWNEEAYYSIYMIGSCYESLYYKNKDNVNLHKAVFYYLDAWQFRPTRAESLYNLSKLYRQEKNYNLSYIFAKLGKDIKYPTDDGLFIRKDIYEYLFDFELSVVCYYIGKIDEGRNYCNFLIQKNVPNPYYDLTISNLKFYNKF